MRSPLHSSRLRRGRALALLTAAALFPPALAACRDTVAPVPEPEEHLVFLSTRDGAIDRLGRPMRDIYRIGADGVEPENLTRQPAQYLHLSVSPDGRRIVFATDRSGCDIWVMSTDGTGAQQLTGRSGAGADGCNAWPRWSPDGSRIAFVTNREGRTSGTTHGLYDVYVMNDDGSDPRNVSSGLGDALGSNVHVAGWSPDGRVVFETFGPEEGPALRRVYTVRADGTDPRPLFEEPGDHSPAWSPDGSRVAFIREREGTRRLHVMRADGSDVRPLTTHAGDDALPGLGGSEAGFEYSPWSPDGTRIAFQRDLEFDWGIYVIGADGSGLRRLTVRPTTFNGWSPGGDRIAYTEAVNRPGGLIRDVFVVNADGTGAVNLTDSPADDSDALWLPR